MKTKKHAHQPVRTLAVPPALAHEDVARQACEFWVQAGQLGGHAMEGFVTGSVPTRNLDLCHRLLSSGGPGPGKDALCQCRASHPLHLHRATREVFPLRARGPLLGLFPEPSMIASPSESQSNDDHRTRHVPSLTRILVVEDDLQMRTLDAEALAAAGYPVDTSHSAQSAWKDLEQRAYNLVITENRKPGIADMEWLGRLREARQRMPVHFPRPTRFAVTIKSSLRGRR